MNIYFSFSLSQSTSETFRDVKQVVKSLEKKGHHVVPSNILSKNSSHYLNQTDKESLEAQKTLTRLKSEADICIFEVTKQSLGIGQEIEIALSFNKPVICIHKAGTNPHLLKDRKTELIVSDSYTINNLDKQLDYLIDYSVDLQVSRYNLALDWKLSRYLEWIADKEKKPKAVFIRDLIRGHMQKNEQFD